MNHLAQELEQALDDGTARISRRDVPDALLEAVTVNELIRMTAEEWGLIVLLWCVMAISPNWMYPFFALALAGRFHALGVILHDASHMPLRRKTMAIRWVECCCGYPIATTLNAMRYHHLRHHRDNGMKTDPYYKTGRQNILWRSVNILRGIVLTPFWTVRAVVGALAYFIPALRNVYAHIFLQDRSQEDLRRSQEVMDCARAEWGQLLVQSLVLLLTIIRPGPVLWGYLIPVSLAGLLAARRLLIEHRYDRVFDRRVETIMAITHDNHLGFAGALILAPRNIGYHIVHHIHPQVRLGALPHLRLWYQQQYPERYPSVARSFAAKKIIDRRDAG